ncbi:hypothetical protein [Streptomyces sp. NPDC058426]|uniref:restriction endonuclease subunit S n=1 Tax=Streptomyces sp. NPDC058426 TaxID=3346493 RepID=UPI0036653FFA
MTSATVPLGEIISPAAVRRAGTTELPILSMTMRNGLVDQADKFKKRVASADTSAYRVVDRGQLVVGFPIDEGVLSFQDLYDSAMVSPAYEVWDLKQPELVSCTFLQRFLRSPRALQYYAAKLQGSTARRRSLPRDVFLALPVPVFSFAEQLRIAALLDQVDTLRAKRREAIALLDDLASSLFSGMFGDVIKRGGGVPLSSVADISSGITKGRKVPSGDLRTTPYLAVANVQDRALDLSTVKEIAASVAEIERYKLLSEDLLLTEGGDPDKLGRGTLWRDELPVCIHQNHVFRVRVKTRAEVDPLYLNWVMSSSYGKGYFLRTAKQTTGIASINKTQLGEFPLPVPPIARQKDFRSRIESVQESQQAHRTHLATLDELFTSLQHRAFSGTLWEHDATGEAA